MVGIEFEFESEMVFRAFKLYRSFLTETASKTRDDYLRLTGIALGFDAAILLTQLPYLVLALAGDSLSPGWTLLRLVLVVFLVVDAILLAYVAGPVGEYKEAHVVRRQTAQSEYYSGICRSRSGGG